MKQDETRRILIAGTIKVIAEEGLDKATTKQIGLATKVNEAYIYRCFKDKEDMFSKTFDSLDCELLEQLQKYLVVMNLEDLPFEQRCRLYFNSIWSFILGNKEKCLTYVRYFYSTYFVKYSADVHKERYAGITQTLSVVFKDEADVWMILNHILNVLLDFAVKVHNNQMSSEDNYTEHVFRVAYRSIEQYFKEV